MDFGPFCVFLCFKVSCFVFEKHCKFYLSSKIFFHFFTLKHGKFIFQRWNCFYSASKSRGNTATERWKRTGTFTLTFTFADKRSRCYGNGLIDVAETWIWSMLNMNCRGCRQRFLPPPDLSKKIEGDSVRREGDYYFSKWARGKKIAWSFLFIATIYIITKALFTRRDFWA